LGELPAIRASHAAIRAIALPATKGRFSIPGTLEAH